MVNACISCSVCTGLKRGDRVYPRKAAGHRYYCTWTSSRPFVHWDCWIYVTRGDLQANRNLHGTKVKRVCTKRSRHSKTARIVNWFSHVIHHDTLSKTVLKGSVEGRRHRGSRRNGGQMCVNEWTDHSMPEVPSLHGRRCVSSAHSDDRYQLASSTVGPACFGNSCSWYLMKGWIMKTTSYS